MLNVTIDEIQRDPLKYLRQVEAGETFVIVQANKAIAPLKIPLEIEQINQENCSHVDIRELQLNNAPNRP